jgi:hypothetical protein
MHHVLVNSVIGYSDGEFKWKMAAMKQIMKETGGVRIPMYLKITPRMLRMAGPLLKHVKDPLALVRRFPVLQDVIHSIPMGKEQKLVQDSRLFWLLVRNAVNTQATFRPSQGMSTMLGSFDTWDMGNTQSEWIAQAKQKYIKRGIFLDDGGDLGCGGTFENAHMGYLEGIFLYASGDPQAVMASGEIIEEAERQSQSRDCGAGGRTLDPGRLAQAQVLQPGRTGRVHRRVTGAPEPPPVPQTRGHAPDSV